MALLLVTAEPIPLPVNLDTTVNACHGSVSLCPSESLLMEKTVESINAVTYFLVAPAEACAEPDVLSWS